jgi:4-alpha-glucanotransferase
MSQVNQRSAGVLLHISGLPAGDLGQDAYDFVDFLASTGARVWQTLPINMTHADNSPYQCLSAHAGNPTFIHLPFLVSQGLIPSTALALPQDAVMAMAYDACMQTPQKHDFEQFCTQHRYWLDDFAMYLVLRDQFHQAGWQDWPVEYKNRHQEALSAFAVDQKTALACVKFTQYVFFTQWLALKQYAHQAGIQLFGDIPIFVAYDSADVWAHPHLFKLDAQQKMTVVAGVPPDYFSATGQRWGNPHYHWQTMAKDDYAWWVDRMRTQSALFDLVRIDHFRGLEAAWEIDANEETAMNGAWVLAPGDELLAAITQALPNIVLVAEDLGIITPEVDALRLKYQLPGMKILQFAFGGDDTNPYLPENIVENSVVYTGTHDNDTTLGWYAQLEPHVKAHLHAYLEIDAPDMPLALVQLAMDSVAKLAIVPMQDILALGSDCRMNTPGTVVGNWAWRFNWAQLTPHLKQQFSAVVKQAGRSLHG